MLFPDRADSYRVGAVRQNTDAAVTVVWSQVTVMCGGGRKVAGVVLGPSETITLLPKCLASGVGRIDAFLSLPIPP